MRIWPVASLGLVVVGCSASPSVSPDANGAPVGAPADAGDARSADAGVALEASDSGQGPDSASTIDSGHDSGPGSADASTSPNLFATAAGTVDVFVNGVAVGRSASAGALFAISAALPEGENVIVVRATSGGSKNPFAEFEVGGAFGKAGSSAQWKVKAASGGEVTGMSGAWATPTFDDTGWANATDVHVPPTAPFPTLGPARGIWSALPSDNVVLLRLKLYVPPAFNAERPHGFARGVTGGQGGQVVTVSTIAELRQALCGSTSGGSCTDSTPRIIELPSQVFDFVGTEGTTNVSVCVVTKCASGPSEYITDTLGGCTGKPTFPATIDSAGNTPLLVGSNKTILGVGPGATLRGKGLTIRGGMTNVIVRNITITDINPQVVWGGDALIVDGADGVWIDHVKYSLIGRQMIVTGFGNASNMTVSYNEFDGVTPYAANCDGAHYWVMLLLGANNTITIQSNWIHNTSGRAPHAGGLRDAQVTGHLVNNDFDHISGFAADPESNVTGNYVSWSKLLLEGNFFNQVTTPILIDTPDGTGFGPGYSFAPTAQATNTALACQSAVGRACEDNLATPANGTFPLDTEVTSAFATVAARSKVTPFPAAEVQFAVPNLAGPGHIK